MEGRMLLYLFDVHSSHSHPIKSVPQNGTDRPTGHRGEVPNAHWLQEQSGKASLNA